MMLCYNRFLQPTLVKGLLVILCITGLSGYPQCPTAGSIKDRLAAVEKDTALSFLQKRDEAIRLKQQVDQCKLPLDSVYARVLSRIGFYDFKVNSDVATDRSIAYTLHALAVNRLAATGSSLSYAISCYKNLGFYYESVSLHSKALDYFDSTVLILGTVPGNEYDALQWRLKKLGIFYEKKDYQKMVDECTIGIPLARKIKDTLTMAIFLSQRSQALYFLGRLEPALDDAEMAFQYAVSIHDLEGIADAQKRKALIAAEKHNFIQASHFLEQAAKTRLQTNNSIEIADDFTDAGNFHLNYLHDYTTASAYYTKALRLAEKAANAELQSKAHLNLGVVSFYKKQYVQALAYNSQALADYHAAPPGRAGAYMNPAAGMLDVIRNKELLLVIFNNRTEILLTLYKQNHGEVYLTAALQTALLMDTLITKVRYEQAGELSKLYWRNKTREFFSNALEACYLAKDAGLAFFFMERSKAVLLNDQLNELGASNRLPAQEASKEQELKIRIRAERYKLDALTPHTPQYDAQQVSVLQAQAALERYIISLEKKYPEYYRYKYADKGITLAALQRYLSEHRQSFVHYFMGDSVTYILGIVPGAANIYRLSQNQLSHDQLVDFVHYCNNDQSLLEKSHEQAFTSLSNTLYKTLFQPLHIPKGRVIVSQDNFILPFDALSTDPRNNRFLLNDYTFSYVYSARYLLGNTEEPPAPAGFVGFAPVSFQPHLGVYPLGRSADAVQKAAAYYRNHQWFIEKNATKNNFIRHFSGFSIVNIFSHAVADTSGGEPLLYMQDSIIRLSELLELESHATSLVVLSACETNTGANAAGEGVYSLARGFASIGIPSVAATLWKADEESIYTITERFHYYLSQGMCKDSALQKSKLDFLRIKAADKESLPYYWAGMIITGNMQPVNLPLHSDRLPWIAGATVFIFLLAGALIIWKRKRSF